MNNIIETKKPIEENKSSVKILESKPQAKPADKRGRPAGKPQAKPAGKRGRPAGTAKPASKRGRPAGKPQAKPAGKRGRPAGTAKPASKRGRPAGKPTGKRAGKRAVNKKNGWNKWIEFASTHNVYQVKNMICNCSYRMQLKILYAFGVARLLNTRNNISTVLNDNNEHLKDLMEDYISVY